MENFKIRYLFYTIHGYISFLIIILISFIIFIPVILIYLFNKNIFLISTRFLIRLLFILYFLPLNKYFKGIKRDKRRKIYIINHLSLIDGLLVYFIPENIKVMGNAIYGKIPIFGIGFKLIGNIAINKKGDGDFLSIYYEAKDCIEKGYPLVIFPEGTRSRDGNIQKFKNGAFSLAFDTQADIIPIVFDTWDFLRPNSFLIRKRKIYIKVLESLRYEDFKNLSVPEVSKIAKIKMIEALIDIKEKDKNYYNYSIIQNLKNELKILKGSNN